MKPWYKRGLPGWIVSGGGGGAVAATGFASWPSDGAVTNLPVTANTVDVYGIPIGYPFTFANIAIFVTASGGAGSYDLGFYNLAGTLVAHIGPQVITATGAFALVGGAKTLPAGLYYFATTGTLGSTLVCQGQGRIFAYSKTLAVAVSSLGALPASIAPPASGTTGIAVNGPCFICF